MPQDLSTCLSRSAPLSRDGLRRLRLPALRSDSSYYRRLIPIADAPLRSPALRPLSRTSDLVARLCSTFTNMYVHSLYLPKLYLCFPVYVLLYMLDVHSFAFPIWFILLVWPYRPFPIHLDTIQCLFTLSVSLTRLICTWGLAIYTPVHRCWFLSLIFISHLVSSSYPSSFVDINHL